MIRLKHQRRNHDPVEITPLLDVVFILLIFFMLTAVVAPHGISLDLPKTETGQTQEDISINLNLKATGELYWNEALLSLEALKIRLAEHGDGELKLLIRADEKVAYGFFVQVMDVIRQSGKKNVFLATEPKVE